MKTTQTGTFDIVPMDKSRTSEELEKKRPDFSDVNKLIDEMLGHDLTIPTNPGQLPKRLRRHAVVKEIHIVFEERPKLLIEK